MDKKEKHIQRSISILLVAGVILSLAILAINRNALAWATSVSWAEIHWSNWLALVVLLVVAVLAQYFLLMLLFYSKLKYLVLAVIPAIWLFNNGIIAMSRFLDWTTDIGATIGWLSIADLFSWLAAAIYFPILLGTGAVGAILDANASSLSQSCYYARMALDIADISAWQVIDFGMNIISIAWDLVANSFSQEVIKYTSDTDSLFDFSLQGIFSMPNWTSGTGYNLACLSL